MTYEWKGRNWSVKELSEELGISETTIRKRLRKGVPVEAIKKSMQKPSLMETGYYERRRGVLEMIRLAGPDGITVTEIGKALKCTPTAVISSLKWDDLIYEEQSGKEVRLFSLEEAL